MLNIRQNVSLQSFNTFRIDARAAWFCEVYSQADLLELVPRLGDYSRYMVLGGGSNVVFSRDYDGLIILNRISGRSLEKHGTGYRYHLGAGENWHQSVLHSVSRDLFGLENLSLIPGTAGAAPIQNIGAYGVELKDIFSSLTAVDLVTGKPVEFDLPSCRFAYRDSYFKGAGAGRYCITSLSLDLQRCGELKTGYGEISEEIDRRGLEVAAMTPAQMSDVIVAIRQRKLPDPAILPNAGSFFKNPVVSRDRWESLKQRFPAMVSYPVGEDKVKLASGWLIDALGWKGRSLNGAGVHERQALVLINQGGGAPAIRALAERIQHEVADTYGVRLEPEPIWVE